MYVFDPDGRPMLVPDQFGGSPTYGGLFAPPPPPPTVPRPPPQPRPPVQDIPISRPVDTGSLHLDDGSAPQDETAAPPVPQDTSLGAPAPMGDAPQIGNALPSMPAAPAPSAPLDEPQPAPLSYEDARTKQLQATQQRLYDATPEGKQKIAEDAQAKAEQEALTAQKAVTAAATSQATDINAIQQQSLADTQAARKAQADQQERLDVIREQKQTAADAAVNEVNNYKVDQDKYWHDSSTGQHIGWYVAMALSGLGNALAGKGGEPNPVIGMLQQKVKDSVAAQMDQRQQLKEKSASAEHALDRFDAFSKDKAAQSELAIAQGLESAKQQVGAAMSKSAIPSVQANGQAAIAQLDGLVAEHKQKAADLATAKQHQDQEMAIQRANVGIAGGHLALAQKQFDWAKDKDQQELNLKAATLAAKQNGKLDAEQAKLAVSAPVADENGNSTGAAAVLTNADHTPWLARSPEVAAKTSGLIASTASYHRLVGDMMRNIQQHGGESDYLKSKAWQQQQSKWKSAIAELHEAYDIKRFGDSTAEFFDKIATGGVNPTSFVYDASAALRESDQDLQAKVNDKLATDNYTGRPVKFTDTQFNSPAATKEDEADKDLLRDPRREMPMDRLSGELGVDMNDPINRTNPGVAINNALVAAKGVLPSQQKALDANAVGLESTNPKAQDKALTTLRKAAEDSPSAGVRAYAQHLLDLHASDSATAFVKRIAGIGSP